MGAHPHGADAARGKVELAQVLCRHGAAFRTRHRLSAVQSRAMRAVEACRSAALGGHIEQCERCGALRYSYHSCRNRHCPKCQTLAQERWLAARRTELLPVPYFHLVFTLPHALNALSQVFRGKFTTALSRALEAGKIRFGGSTLGLAEAAVRTRLLAELRAQPWVVYAKRPFAGPKQVLDYLGRYTHRVAISNHRLVSVDATDVRFRYKDYAHGNRHKVMRLEAHEFIRRFLLHVLPTGFMRIRHYGLLANRTKHTKLAQARRALDCPLVPESAAIETVEAFWLRIADLDIHQCPQCRAARMITIGAVPAAAPIIPRARPP